MFYSSFRQLLFKLAFNCTIYLYFKYSSHHEAICLKLQKHSIYMKKIPQYTNLPSKGWIPWTQYFSQFMTYHRDAEINTYKLGITVYFNGFIPLIIVKNVLVYRWQMVLAKLHHLHSQLSNNR